MQGGGKGKRSIIFWLHFLVLIQSAFDQHRCWALCKRSKPWFQGTPSSGREAEVGRALSEPWKALVDAVPDAGLVHCEHAGAQSKLGGELGAAC